MMLHLTQELDPPTNPGRFSFGLTEKARQYFLERRSNKDLR